MKPYAAFVDEAFVRILRMTPEVVAKMGLSGLPQFAGLDDRLDDYSVAGAHAREDLLAEVAAAHARYARDRLGAADQLTFDVFDFFLRYLPFEPWVGTAGREFMLHPYPVRHLSGAPADTFNVLVNMHEVRNVDDAEAYLERLLLLHGMFRDLADGLEHRRRLGLSPPRAALAIIRGELEAVRAAGTDANELVTSFAEKLAAAGAIPPAQAQQLQAQAHRLVDDFLRHALPLLLECVARLESAASPEPGVWRLPHGDGFHRYALTRETSLALAPDEVYRLGEAEVARLHAELAQDAAALGCGDADLARALGGALRADAAAAADTDARRAEILAHYTRLVDDTAARMRPCFNLYPKAHCVVRPSPRHLEQRRTTTYYPPSATGAYPAAFELCLFRELHKAPWARHAVAYHEAYPGHHVQLTIAQELAHLPLFRRTFLVAAYLEGWAKYAERLPFETGLDTDPRYELQRKANELISASNLMLDAGIHARRWNREQAVAFSAGTALVDAPLAEYLVDRVTVTPGQTTSYMVGLNQVRTLRADLERRRGARFTLPEFHDLLLGEGALPLPVLQRRFQDKTA